LFLVIILAQLEEDKPNYLTVNLFITRYTTCIKQGEKRD